jgi:alpha-D-ribose 1-methylphosphonate 5-triphosphate synthase subunit PhnH
MSLAADLSKITPGFAEPVMESQTVFRRALHAMSRPGEIVEIDCCAEFPNEVHLAAGALLLVLLDQGTRLWLSPSVASECIGAYFRFHTWCTVVERPVEADVAFIGAPQELPRLESFPLGTENYPERSATVVIQVERLVSPGGWTLRGPGIADRSTLAPSGLDDRFVRQWSQLHSLFPRGIDVFLASGGRLAGLPRTTRIEV